MTTAPQRALTLTGGLLLSLGAVYADTFHDPSSTAWKFRYGQTSSGYSDAWNDYKAAGYLPIDIETDVLDGNTRYAGVWQKNEDNRGWASWRNLTNDEFKERWEEYKNLGYRPLDQDVAVVNGNVRYSLIMVENKENLAWKSYRNLSSAEFSEKFVLNKDDYLPIDVNAIEVNGAMRYSIIWIENVGNKSWKLWRDLSPDDYGDRFQQYKDWARVSDIDPYRRNGTLNYAAVWVENEPGRAWAAVRQMSATDLRNRWKQYHDRGMRVTDIEAYPTANGGVQYSALFRENALRYDWSGRGLAQNLLKDFVNDNSAPGVSAAIICKGRVVFRAGAGFADAEKDLWAHGGSIHRSGSLAKSVTAVLGYEMQDAGLIDLGDTTTSIVPGLSSQHDHTVLQLLQNTGCIGGYSDIPGDQNDDQTQYDSALQVLEEKEDGIFSTNAAVLDGCTPGDSYTYSTIGYTHAAAAMEVEGDDSFDVLLKGRVADPLGLSTLRAETRTSPDSSGDLVKLYDKAVGGYEPVTNAEFENNSWKWGGGGIESSPVDMALLGDALLGNLLFPKALRDEMWTGTDANAGYAAGWNVNAKNNATVITKRGRQQAGLAHIRIDLNEEITVVAMTNGSYTSDEGSIISTLTSDLMNLAKRYCDPSVEPDRDGDGISDKWEEKFAGTLGKLSDKQDADRDGRSDRAEFEAGTNPLDAASAFRLWIKPQRRSLTINWTCVPDREYTLLQSRTLKDGDWVPVRAMSGLVGSRTGTMSLEVPLVAGQPRMFWKVEARARTTTSVR